MEIQIRLICQIRDTVRITAGLHTVWCIRESVFIIHGRSLSGEEKAPFHLIVDHPVVSQLPVLRLQLIIPTLLPEDFLMPVNVRINTASRYTCMKAGKSVSLQLASGYMVLSGYVIAFRNVFKDPFTSSTNGSFDGNSLLPHSTVCSTICATPVLSVGGVRNAMLRNTFIFIIIFHYQDTHVSFYAPGDTPL